MTMSANLRAFLAQPNNASNLVWLLINQRSLACQ